VTEYLEDCATPAKHARTIQPPVATR
jgi:hypothetical protein